MKKLVVGVALAVIGACCRLDAASLDGTSSLVYKSNLQIFRNGLNEYARGFVRLDNGIAVGPSATAFMDTNISVSGPIDLGETGVLVLLNSMYADGSITLTSSGNIKGKPTVSGEAKTIFLGGDLTLASDSYARVLHITGDWSKSGTSGDLIIDGQGHLLDIQDRAQIFVDQNVTLTLRNMTIRTGPKSLNNPAIQLASPGSKLALDNVMFDLGADFHFISGQIFVHNEVAVTGTSAFVYQSPVPSYITSGATWAFDVGTTFSVAPATFTDCLFTVNNTYTTNKFIVLADASSALYLNGCSLKTTYTGLRLTNGMVMLDNRVAIDTMAGVDLATTTTSPATFVVSALTGVGPNAVAWSPNSGFVVVVNQGDATLQVYRFNGQQTLTTVGSTVAAGTNPQLVAWSPDGRFIAVVGYDSNSLRVYRFNGSSTPTLVGSVATTDATPYSVSWSPDGRYLLVAGNSNTLRIWRFDGVSTPVMVGPAVSTAVAPAAAWSPDGRYIAVVTFTAQVLQVFRFNDDRVVQVGSNVALGYASAGVSWSPDGRFIAVGIWGGAAVAVYRFNGKSTPMIVNSSATANGNPFSTSWSPDGRFFAVANVSTNFQIFKCDGIVKPALMGTMDAGGTAGLLAWSPNGNFIAVTSKGTNRKLEIFRCNFVSTPVTQQSFTNGLLFGDSSKGSNYNVDVNVAGSARVEVNGKVTDDSA